MVKASSWECNARVQPWGASEGEARSWGILRAHEIGLGTSLGGCLILGGGAQGRSRAGKAGGEEAQAGSLESV